MHTEETNLLLSANVMSYEKSAGYYDLFDHKENIGFFTRCTSGLASVLDIGAGTGRIAIPLAGQGLRVCCVEPSPAMRKAFENKLAERPDLRERIRLIGGNAESFKVDQHFPAAILSGCFDHFLDDRERIESLKNIGWHLVPGGVLLFDVFIGLMADSPLSSAGSANFNNKEIRRFVSRRLLPDRRLVEITLVYELFEDNKMVERLEEKGLVGIVDRRGVHRVLDQSGFKVMQEWGGYDFEPYKAGDAVLIIKATRGD